MPSHKRLDHVGVMVRDLEATIDFYTKVVGLELKDRVKHTNGVIELAFLGFNGSDETEVELIQGYSDSLPAEGAVHHFAVSTDQIEAEYARVQKLGVPHLDEEIVTLPNGYRYFFLHGPNGEWIEFFQR
ncbi:MULTISPECIES: VOC family protein [Paenibacillus]|uniref:Glyoxalase/bleomycin resistance/dioxygenase family protein n=1 Tax=Paenibacillus campinasensis TaxID=66347 RepID=A0A268EDW6_9BACL|nr:MULTISPECIES: VOC family protein [Paenibacillus]MUG65368.1 VOC family protein [Paenibacillus campinasensis]PAD71309.1 glyoxalase/bleomycin resistance/dioxygenase family protein [Paenibacillus campinasensis]PAK49552.1 glyoxalase/bleomycin resistance/dioxygenase family protein [Paenibacillus sp. 7541]